MEKKVSKVLMTVLVIYIVAFMVMAIHPNTISQAENPDSSLNGKMYAANRLDQEPHVWYLPEDIGIIKVIDYGHANATWVHVVVADEPFPLDVELPCFRYNDNFYKISCYHVTPASSAGGLGIPLYLVLGLLLWMIATALFFYELRRRNKQSVSR